MEYYKNLITGKSFKILQDLKRRYDFILIGGWAVFLYTRALKSKDIDIIVEYDGLEKLRQAFNLIKNDRLKKYEIVLDEIDIDIYTPFYSDLGIPAEEIRSYAKNIEGFLVPRAEVLLILKQRANLERAGTPKGKKDEIDILGLLQNAGLDLNFYKEILKKYGIESYLVNLRNLLKGTNEAPEIGLNQFKYSRLKKKILNQLA